MTAWDLQAEPPGDTRQLPGNTRYVKMIATLTFTFDWFWLLLWSAFFFLAGAYWQSTPNSDDDDR